MSDIVLWLIATKSGWGHLLMSRWFHSLVVKNANVGFHIGVYFAVDLQFPETSGRDVLFLLSSDVASGAVSALH